ncbi:MAG: tetratricopeptide repeat protein [Myxococcota bacterium]
MSDRPMHTQKGAFAELTALYADGERAMSEGRFADAIACFDRGLAIDDHFRQRYVTMYAQRGFARHRLGDLAGAIADYTAAIAMEPPIHQAQYHFHRALCHAGLGGHEAQALADYAASIALYPDHPGPYHMRGKMLVDLGRWEEAIADFDALLARSPHPEGHQLRGYARLNLGQAEAAVPDLLTAAEAAPSAWGSYLLAWAGAASGDAELFYRGLEEALAAEPAYRSYFLEAPDFAPYRGQRRFLDAVGQA